MPFVIKLIAAPVAGVVASGAIMFGVVYSQAKAPSTNPASKPIIAYGNTN